MLSSNERSENAFEEEDREAIVYRNSKEALVKHGKAVDEWPIFDQVFFLN